MIWVRNFFKIYLIDEILFMIFVYRPPAWILRALKAREKFLISQTSLLSPDTGRPKEILKLDRCVDR